MSNVVTCLSLTKHLADITLLGSNTCTCELTTLSLKTGFDTMGLCVQVLHLLVFMIPSGRTQGL